MQRPARLLERVIARPVDLLDSAETLAHADTRGRVQGISASKENDEERLMETVKNYVLSLAPCMEVENEFNYA
jgi:hypothetical protein